MLGNCHVFCDRRKLECTYFLVITIIIFVLLAFLIFIYYYICNIFNIFISDHEHVSINYLFWYSGSIKLFSYQDGVIRVIKVITCIRVNIFLSMLGSIWRVCVRLSCCASYVFGSKKIVILIALISLINLLILIIVSPIVPIRNIHTKKTHLLKVWQSNISKNPVNVPQVANMALKLRRPRLPR